MRAFLVAEADRIGVSQAARNIGVSRQTVYRWRRRAGSSPIVPADRTVRRGGRASSARRHCSPRAGSGAGDRTAIGPMTGIARRTAYRILRRFGAHRLRELFPVERPRRGVFTAREPGEVVQIDIKTLGRLTGLPRHSAIGEGRPGRTHRGVTGYQHVHVAIDAASRHSYIEVRPGLGAVDCAAFVGNAVAAFDALGIRVSRVLTDNGSGYKRTFAEACAAAGVRWTRTKPYHPWTNGRAERFIRTLQREVPV